MLPRGYLIGNLTADPKSGVSSNSNNYSRFSIACNDNYSKLNTSPKAHFFNCVAWGKRAQYIQSYLKKGDSVFVEFTVLTNSFTNSEGRVIKSIDLMVDRIEIVYKRSSAGIEKKSFDSENSLNDENIYDEKNSSKIDDFVQSEKEDNTIEEIDFNNISLDDIYSKN